jgi:hypothetical protein
MDAELKAREAELTARHDLALKKIELEAVIRASAPVAPVAKESERVVDERYADIGQYAISERMRIPANEYWRYDVISAPAAPSSIDPKWLRLW